VGFEEIGGLIAEGGMLPFGIIIGQVVTNFQARFAQVGETAAVEQFGFEPTPKRFSMGVVVTVTASAHTLHGLVTGQ